MPDLTLPTNTPSCARARPFVPLVFGAIGIMSVLTVAGAVHVGMDLLSHPTRSVGPLPVEPPADPRLTYQGPFLNIRPDVAYVGDDSCAACHEKESLSYHRHPMGRSLLPIAQVAAQPRYDADARNPFNALGAFFQVNRVGDRVRYRQTARDEDGRTIYEADTPVDYVIGSGTHGCSFLINRDGYLFQAPVSWFSSKPKQIWGASPGFDAELRAGRPVQPGCLFCHANQARPREGYANRYENPPFIGLAIGCERCHGPGARHVAYPGHKDPQTGADYTIVNPKYLPHELRAAVCQQCHLEGEARVVRRGRGLYDFRPGLPLREFWSVFVHARELGEDRKAVNHVEQMYLSKCFQLSEDKGDERKMGCTSCHDPHEQETPGRRVVHYRERCLTCHRQRVRGCSISEEARRLENKDDSCINCHMPPYSSTDVAHHASSDHRIILRQEKDAPARPTLAPRDAGFNSFYGGPVDPRDEESTRDLGIALVSLAQDHKANPTRAAEQAVPLLQAAVSNDRDDLDAWLALGQALATLNRSGEAIAAFEIILAKSPRHETALLGAATVTQSLNQLEPALSYWCRVVDENPWNAHYRRNLAQLLAHKKDWTAALPHCEAWLRLDPASVDARALRVTCLLKTGDKAEARAEFARLERMQPPNLNELRAKFEVDSRQP